MPAIISLDNSVLSIWTIPFPAVTVCSANKVRPSVYNYSDVDNINYEDKYAGFLCEHNIREYNIFNSHSFGLCVFIDRLIRDTMYGICENNPRKKKRKSYEDFLDGSSVSQVLKESILLLLLLLLLYNSCRTFLFSHKFMHYGVLI